MKAHSNKTKLIETAISHSIRTSVISLALLVAACGGGGGGGSAPAGTISAVASSPAPQANTAVNSFTMTSDNYGMENATYLAASKSALGIVLRAAIASSMTDQNFETVTRIDIPPGASISTGSVYSLVAATATGQAFPGNIYFLNGHPSTLLKTVGGTISFAAFGNNSGDRVSGSYSAVIEDGNAPSTPKPRYTVTANFDFLVDSFGPVLPAPPSVAIASLAIYDANCAACHSLGSHDTTVTGASDLALEGGRMNGIFTPGLPSHQGISLEASDINALKVLLNSN